jgi:hypothetical protein
LWKTKSLWGTELDKFPCAMAFSVCALVTSLFAMLMLSSKLSMPFCDMRNPEGLLFGIAGAVGMFAVVQEYHFVGMSQ